VEIDRVYGGIPRFLPEAPWSKRLALRLLRAVPARVETVLFGEVLTVAAVRGGSDVVFVCADPEALVPEVSQRRLVEFLARGGFDLVFPVSNESPDSALKSPPGFNYATVSDLVEVAGLMAAGGAIPSSISRADFPVYAARRSFLSGFPSALSLSELPRTAGSSARMAVDRGAYVHRYGDLDASERMDLVDRIPPGARTVLDVGCAQGAPAGALRRRGVEEIVGIEPDPDDARIAASRYDRVVAARLDAIVEERWSGHFDAILFGDVLEHLEDPGLALEQVRGWLSPQGRIVASVPNVGNSAVVADLIEGRFDYIPYSILSGTHLRFFTRSSLSDLFESCGYVPEEISGIPGEPTPRVRAWTEHLAALSGGRRDLAVTEFVIVARAAAKESD
jgi:2-polyprenyl-3-methyl-5-hydroxy-6-metoxy-1,4-benzoquinol methylase